MPRNEPEENPLSESMNIRPPEERYGGQGHAGDDPHAGPGTDEPADPSVEIPNASTEELIELPKTDPEATGNESDGKTQNSHQPTARERIDKSKG